MKKIFTLAVIACLLAGITPAQVTQINDNNNLNLVAALNEVKTIFVSETDNTLWVSEGTAVSTVKLSQTILFVETGGILNGKLIFTGSTAATGQELYLTDGTPAGTQLLKDIQPGAISASPSDFVMVNNILYCFAETASEGLELWRTDGTPAGTTLVKDINPGNAWSNENGAYFPFPMNNYFLFAAKGSNNGVELWKSDGTAAGTVQVKDINPGTDSSKPQDFYMIGNTAIFTAQTAANGREHWRSDGTEAGTYLLKDIRPGTGSCTEFELFPGSGFAFPIISGYFTFNGRAYFQASDGYNNGLLYGTDGTAANTTLLKKVIGGATVPFMLMFDAITLPGKFMFPVWDSWDRTTAIWQSDGTAAGTTLFKAFEFQQEQNLPIFIMLDFNGTSTGFSQSLFQGNKFFFAASTLAEGTELWVSDGTLPGTNLVKNIGPGTANGLLDSNFSYLLTSEALFFAVKDGTHGIELWRSNGTGDGTTLVKDIWLNTGSSSPLLMLNNNGRVYFGANDGDDPLLTDLYVLDGIFNPLPLTSIDLTATDLGSDVRLQWQTQSEINISHFTLQRSAEGRNFETIGSMQAGAGSGIRKQYSFTDAKVATPPGGVLYYRIIINDQDGKQSFSKVVSVKRITSNWQVRMLYDPQGSLPAIALSGTTEPVYITVFDLSGKVVQTFMVPAAQTMVRMPLHNQPNGMYILQVKHGNETKSLRMIH